MKKEKRKGVGGWLIVWIVYSSLISLSLLLGFLESFEFFSLLGIGAFGWMIFKFSQKENSVPKVCIYFLDILIAINITQIIPILFEAIKGDYVEGIYLLDYVFFLFGSLITIGLNIVWICYFKKSKRVKNTFVK
ncbi:DUF2569 family protein [Candidatus Woesearchaeota archaeon]|nr:DUF2569 family protein [Candidatus Woesearchaeota archaeon]